MKQCTKCHQMKDEKEYWGRGQRKNGKKRLYSYCNICARKKQKQYRIEEPVKYKYWNRNKESTRTQMSKDQKNKQLQILRDNLDDSYIINLLVYNNTLNRKDITPEMIEGHKLNIKLKRALGLTSHGRFKHGK